jgi:hypothetical protein
MARKKTHAHRALEIATRLGWIGDHVERRITRKVTRDWLGFADSLFVHPDRLGMLAIQATDPSNVSARLRKCLREPNVLMFLAAGNRVEVWGVRDNDTLKARTITITLEGDIRVVDGSLVHEEWEGVT